MRLSEQAKHKTLWIIRRYADDKAYKLGRVYEESVIDGNLLLDEGGAEFLDIACGLGAPTAFNNANARLGVGDSTTVEDATQTDLQAAVNKAYKAMKASYPSRAAQTVTFRSVFGPTDANFDWQEFAVDNGAAAAKTLNRKVSNQGTKAAGQTWTLDLQITLS